MLKILYYSTTVVLMYRIKFPRNENTYQNYSDGLLELCPASSARLGNQKD